MKAIFLISSLGKTKEQFLREYTKSQSAEERKNLHQRYLGKRGIIRQLLRQLTKLPPGERAGYGKKLNELKELVTSALGELEVETLKAQPVNRPPVGIFDPLLNRGHLHPLTHTLTKTIDIFARMGFQLAESRLLDNAAHVFTSLNFPENHPARDIMDTIWTKNNLIPIPHTSSMQNRVLKTQPPPIRTIVFGRCFRMEATDARHEHTFYQVEGVAVDRSLTLTDLIGTLQTFLREFFGAAHLPIKIQPSFFPFVEPGIEILAKCTICHGKRCFTCGHSGWIELVPAGMIHPRVLQMGGLNPRQYQGFAWAIGLDRLMMLEYGIDDIRLVHSGDLRFVEQF